MNYKKIIRSRKARIRILQMFDLVPDAVMIRIQYYIKTGRRLNLRHPQRLTEKLQWYKLYYRDPLMKQCVDKYDVRDFVEEKGLAGILIPFIGIYEKPENIPFHALPESFVIKDTMGGGGNGVILCKDKKKLNESEAKETIRGWLNPPGKRSPGREWFYEGIRHRIYIEQYLESDEQNGGLIDYKFFCFHGKAEFLYVITDRKMGDNAQVGVFDMNFNRIPCQRLDEEPLTRAVEKPEKFEEMIEVAQTLAASFPHVRVDLYYQAGRIWFGELTFCNGSGYMRFEPDEFDFWAGERFQLPPNDKCRKAYEGGGGIELVDGFHQYFILE